MAETETVTACSSPDRISVELSSRRTGTFVLALLLLILGVVAIVSTVFNVGPLG